MAIIAAEQRRRHLKTCRSDTFRLFSNEMVFLITLKWSGWRRTQGHQSHGTFLMTRGYMSRHSLTSRLRLALHQQIHRLKMAAHGRLGLVILYDNLRWQMDLQIRTQRFSAMRQLYLISASGTKTKRTFAMTLKSTMSAGRFGTTKLTETYIFRRK